MSQQRLACVAGAAAGAALIAYAVYNLLKKPEGAASPSRSAQPEPSATQPQSAVAQNLAAAATGHSELRPPAASKTKPDEELLEADAADLRDLPAEVPSTEDEIRSTTPSCLKIPVNTPRRPALHDAAKEGDLLPLMCALDEPGCDIGKCHLGLTAVHLAAAYGHTEAVALLLERGADLHSRAVNMATPLHCAAEANRTEVIAQLLDRGADVHATANKEDTALHYAAFNGRLAATKLLVARGADVHAKDRDGDTPRDDAIGRGNGKCPCEDTAEREWLAVAAFLGQVMPMAAQARQSFAQRAWERPEAAVLHDAALEGDVHEL